MRRLNGLSDTPNGHYSRFSLDWLDSDLVGTHPILGPLGTAPGKAAAAKPPLQLKFRPELLAPLDKSATPLVQLKPRMPLEPPTYPLYVSTLGRGRIVHFGFATFTQIPKDFDQAVGGRFGVRCLQWLAGRELELKPRSSTVTTAPTTGPTTTRPANGASIATNRRP
jgi:hypothetical protein